MPSPAIGSPVPALPRDLDPPAGREFLVDLGPADPSTLTGYRWPVRHARITNAYGKGRPGSFRIDGQTMHEGIDIANYCYAPILAAHDGVVLVAGRHYYSYVGWVGDLAPFRARMSPYRWRQQSIVVVIDDGNGYRSMYFHLALAAVKAGQVVRAGERIGYQGETGAATGCHLHYALFSPLETRTLRLDPQIAARTRLPERAILRIDPLLVLPPPSDAFIDWSWNAR